MQPATAPQNVHWRWIFLGYLSLFTYGFIDNSRGPVFPDVLQEYALSDSMGALFFLLSSTAALINNTFLLGWMNRSSGLRLLQIYCAIQAVGLVVIGLSSRYWGTLGGAAILGVTFGGLAVAQNHLVVEGSPIHLRRRLLAGLHSTYGLASLMAPMAVSGFYSIGVSWRGVLGFLAFGPIAVFVCSIVGPKASAETSAVAKSFTAKGRSTDKASISVISYYSLIATFYVIAEITVSSRLALWSRREWHDSAATANQVMTAYFTAMFIGRVLFATVHFPWRSRRVLLAAGTLGVIILSVGLLEGPWWLAFSGLGLSVFYPCLIALITEEQGVRAREITSWAMTIQSLGLIGLQFALGGLTDTFGLTRALWIAPVCLLLAVFGLTRKVRRQDTPS